MTSKHILIIVVVSFLIFGGGYMATKQTRALRNNNPLNIEFNAANDWDGQIGIEKHSNPRFAKFSDMKYGVRAAAKLLKKYIESYGLKTPYAVINRWAPAVENDSNHYAEYVAKQMGINAYGRISQSDIPELIYYMCKFESGSYIGRDVIADGCALAGVV